MDARWTIPDDVEGLIFDCDGTLVDTMPAHFVVWREVLAEHGIDFPEKLFYELAGVPSVGVVAAAARAQGVEVDARVVGALKDARYLSREDKGAAIAPVVAIARAERGRRKLAVASGNVTEIVMRTLRGARIDDLFEVVVGADQVARGKPSPDVFLRAAERIGVPPPACLVYEDGDLGIEAARAAGMRWVDVRPLIAST
ncbi:MAG: HAD-IA family hydrolase [Sandaracinus sp.]